MVIGAGGAGLRAAIAAHEAGARVAIVCKSLLGKAHTVMAEGGIAAAMGNLWPEDNWEVHFRDTMRGGKMLNNWRMAQLHAQEAPERVLELEDWGALFDRTEDGLISQRDFGGHRYARLAHVGDRTGLEMIRTLQQRAVALGIDVFMEFTVTELLKERRPAISGAFGYWRETGRFVVFEAPSVVLATGGIGKSFQVTSNSWEYTGDGHALALRAGASLINMEFVQFHPTGMVWPPSVKGLLVTESVRGDGGILKNSEGERFMFDYIPEFFKSGDGRHRSRRPTGWYDDKKNNRRPPELLPRDEVARAINSEIKAGRGSPHGGIFLDIASRRDAGVHPPPAAVDVPPVQGARGRRHHRRADGDRADLPLRDGWRRGRRPTPSRASSPACTPRASAPAACTAPTGSGGNSLSDLLVFGRRAGEATAAYAAGLRRAARGRRGGDQGRGGRRARPFDPGRLGRGDAETDESANTENPYTIQQDLQQTMHDLVGIIRTRRRARAVARGDREAQGARRSTCSSRGTGSTTPAGTSRSTCATCCSSPSASPRRPSSARSPAAGTPATTSPGPNDEWGQEPRAHASTPTGTGVDLTHQPLPVMPDELKAFFDPASSRLETGREVVMGYDLKMRIWRGDVDGGELGDYTVEVEEGEVVLDAIHRLQATQAGDLAVRWNCKAGKCGSCSAEINGRPRLMCMTRLSDFEPTETITVTPMRAFPVIRDLVTDVSFNYEKAKQLPAFAPPPRDADGKRRMAQVDVERGQEFRKCIECFLCQNVCHVVRDHEENKPAFAGPRFFLRYAELDMHPLDTNDRRKLAQDAAGIGMCNITKCCTEVCPEGIKITDNAIIPMKERVVDRKYDPLVWLGTKIGLRNKDNDGRDEL